MTVKRKEGPKCLIFELKDWEWHLNKPLEGELMGVSSGSTKNSSSIVLNRETSMECTIEENVDWVFEASVGGALVLVLLLLTCLCCYCRASNKILRHYKMLKVTTGRNMKDFKNKEKTIEIG